MLRSIRAVRVTMMLFFLKPLDIQPTANPREPRINWGNAEVTDEQSVDRRPNTKPLLFNSCDDAGDHSPTRCSSPRLRALRVRTMLFSQTA